MILETVLLSHVRVLVGGVGRSLDIGFVNQTLDALLDHADGGGKTSFRLTQNLSGDKENDTFKNLNAISFTSIPSPLKLSTEVIYVLKGNLIKVGRHFFICTTKLKLEKLYSGEKKSI